MQQGLCSQIRKKSLSLDAIHMRFPQSCISERLIGGAHSSLDFRHQPVQLGDSFFRSST